MADNKRRLGLILPETQEDNEQALSLKKSDEPQPQHSEAQPERKRYTNRPKIHPFKEDTAAGLIKSDEEGNALHGRELLNQMEDDLQRLAASTEAHPVTNSAAHVCLDLVRHIQKQVPDSDLEPSSNGYLLMAISSIYTRLQMPTLSAMGEAMEAEAQILQANLKRSIGGKNSGKRREQERAERMARGHKLWKQFADAGMNERFIASRVAERMGVSAVTVRKWRNAGWKARSKKRK